MTAEEVFCDLFDKYGDDFNWHIFYEEDREGLQGTGLCEYLFADGKQYAGI